MTLLVSNFLTLVCIAHAEAQPLTIDDCMRYAVENSTTVGKQRLAADDNKTNYQEAIASLFPSVNAEACRIRNFRSSNCIGCSSSLLAVSTQ